jgi:hypothetical protein
MARMSSLSYACRCGLVDERREQHQGLEPDDNPVAPSTRTPRQGLTMLRHVHDRSVCPIRWEVGRTLRHYEQVGILVSTETDPNTGYRQYRAEQVARLHRSQY